MGFAFERLSLGFQAHVTRQEVIVHSVKVIRLLPIDWANLEYNLNLYEITNQVQIQVVSILIDDLLGSFFLKACFLFAGICRWEIK
jgi:hypothetical protein